MRRVFAIVLMLLPLLARADGEGAVRLLDRAVAHIKSDGGVQMDFEYSAYDAGGEPLFAEKGLFYADCRLGDKGKERFALLLDELKIWCDGVQQWNYSARTGEIYITAADSDEAQSLSPLHIMQLYKSGYNCSLDNEGANDVVTLLPIDDSGEFTKVMIYINKVSLQPVRMRLFMGDNGRIDIAIKSYKGGLELKEATFVCPVNDFPNVEIVDMR